VIIFPAVTKQGLILAKGDRDCACSGASTGYQDSIGGIFLKNKRRAVALQPGSGFDKFEPTLQALLSNACPGWKNLFLIGVF
jgi:hypothetical protein